MKNKYDKNSLFKPTDIKEEQLEKLEYIILELREIPPSIEYFMFLNELIERCIKLKFHDMKLDGNLCNLLNVMYREIIMKKPLNNNILIKFDNCRYCGASWAHEIDLNEVKDFYEIECHLYCSKKCRDAIKNVSEFGKKILDSNR